MIDVEISNRQRALKLDRALLRKAVKLVLEGENFESAEISLAVVDDPQIHELNRRWLDHDYPTDVISFVLEQDERHLESEIIVSADTAAQSAQRFGWAAADELLLYVIHGTLHLAGYDDLDDDEQQRMRERERHYLSLLGRTPPAGDPFAVQGQKSSSIEAAP